MGIETLSPESRSRSKEMNIGTEHRPYLKHEADISELEDGVPSERKVEVLKIESLGIEQI